MKEQSPLVSVITPFFNRAEYIEETIQSVLAQSYSNWEHLWIDDGSNDESIHIVKKYSKKDTRIKYFKRNRLPKNANTCRNIGLENAKGKYVIFLDSDDLLAPFCIESRVKYMEENEGLDFAVFPMAFIKNDIIELNERNIWDTKKDLENLLKDKPPWGIMSPIWKFSFLKKIRGLNEKLQRHQDQELHTRALIFNGAYQKVKHVQENALVSYRIYDSPRYNTLDFQKKNLEGALHYIHEIIAISNECSTIKKGLELQFESYFKKYYINSLLLNNTYQNMVSCVNKYTLFTPSKRLLYYLAVHSFLGKTKGFRWLIYQFL
ncbi:glycosyltransferase family 2 protein [Sediminitomix flava]|uniref:Glycosyltransferase involved in cell wall biosynthesis n=1 Tax=Sediminitomix flava TaxID=379075 RepID=A0A315Z7K9_SEDFL|nr:glycosyltransferase family 2 protein [Sediminitomix flava]PWJ40911.1 glycosyltransferase involved in cell wall biosynthesis [Sediminitomix flava]